MCCAMLQALRVEAEAAVASSLAGFFSQFFQCFPCQCFYISTGHQNMIWGCTVRETISANAHVYAKAYLKQQKDHTEPNCTTYWVHHYMQLFPFLKNGTVIGNTQIRYDNPTLISDMLPQLSI